MSIGERITKLRKQRNISQSQLAVMMDVSRQAVSKWENDISAPDTIRLIQLADALSTDVEYLATGNHQPQNPPEIIKVVETVERVVEKVVDRPIVVQKIVEVEKAASPSPPRTVVNTVIRNRYLRNPVELILIGAICFIAGVLVGLLL